MERWNEILVRVNNKRFKLVQFIVYGTFNTEIAKEYLIKGEKVDGLNDWFELLLVLFRYVHNKEDFGFRNRQPNRTTRIKHQNYHLRRSRILIDTIRKNRKVMYHDFLDVEEPSINYLISYYERPGHVRIYNTENVGNLM